MWIERIYAATLRRLAAQFPAVVLTGGAELAETSPERFLAESGEPLIVDEIQYAPRLLRHLKVAIDRDRRPGRGSRPWGACTARGR
ncbi:MAG: hypothetical protein D6739_05085 [Nitrospirae bacterium]|nr:MAG: hypothetical protein D6739_05085 [Nitrospirota bacterium]